MVGYVKLQGGYPGIRFIRRRKFVNGRSELPLDEYSQKEISRGGQKFQVEVVPPPNPGVIQEAYEALVKKHDDALRHWDELVAEHEKLKKKVGNK